MADDAEALDLLDIAIGIGNNPVTRNKLRRHRPDVADSDVISEHKAVARHVGLFGQVFGFNDNLDVVFLALSHPGITREFALVCNHDTVMKRGRPAGFSPRR